MVVRSNSSDVRPAERTDESVVVHARRGNISLNRYWFRMDDGHHELRFDVEDTTVAPEDAPFHCMNLTRRQARDLRDALSEALSQTGARR
jgi:hypothetical protein